MCTQGPDERLEVSLACVHILNKGHSKSHDLTCTNELGDEKQCLMPFMAIKASHELTWACFQYLTNGWNARIDWLCEELK